MREKWRKSNESCARNRCVEKIKRKTKQERGGAKRLKKKENKQKTV